jgi:alpha-tubulin suppressor-like RCC1 family protein
MNYTPKQYNFDPKFVDINDIRLMGCGRRHYIIVTNDNNIVCWGNVFKEKTTDTEKKSMAAEGFNFYYGDSLFDGGQITKLEVKNSIFGALIQH